MTQVLPELAASRETSADGGDPGDAPDQPSPAGSLFWLGTAGLSVLLLATVWTIPYLPTNDGPQHVFSAYVENHYSDPGTIYADQLISTWQFASKGFALVFRPLEPLFGWQNALRITQSLILLATAAGFVAVVRALHPARTTVGLFGFPLALSWGFYMGLFPYLIGSALGLFTLAMVIRGCHARAWRWGWISVLLFVQAVLHIFSAAVTGVIVACLVVSCSRRDERWRNFGKVTLAGLPAVGIQVAAAFTQSQGQVMFQPGVTVLPWRQTMAFLPRIMAPGPSARAFAMTALVLVALGFALWRTTRPGTRSAERVLAATALTCLVLGIVVPRDIRGWQLLSPRFLPLAALLALALVPFERLTERRRRLLAGGSLLMATTGSLLVSLWFHQRLADGCADVIAAFSIPVRRRALQLPVNLDPYCGVSRDPLKSEIPFTSPLRHIGSLFAVIQGGSTPHLFADSASAHAFKVREGGIPVPPVPDLRVYWPLVESNEFKTNDAIRRGAIDKLATIGMYYEGVLVTGGRPADFDGWRARGFSSDWERGSVFIGHFEPCTVDVTLAASEASEPPRFDVGAGPRTTTSGAKVEGHLDGDVVHFVIEGAPCGRIWVRPRWDPPTRACGNSAPSGKVYATVTRDDARIACTGVIERHPAPATGAAQ